MNIPRVRRAKTEDELRALHSLLVARDRLLTCERNFVRHVRELPEIDVAQAKGIEALRKKYAGKLELP